MPEPLTSQRCILVAEDEYMIADDLTRDLSTYGFEVIGPVATLDAALASFAERQPDIAVLDINLRGDSVFPLADLLSEREVPFVFATGYDAEAIPSRFEAVPRHEKPIRTSILLATLDRLMGKGQEAPAAASGGVL